MTHAYGTDPRYVIVSRNAATRDARVIARRATLSDAIAYCEAYLPDPAHWRPFASLTVHRDDTSGPAEYTRQGTAGR